MGGIPGVSSEFTMFENVLVEFVADFVEVVHVELPHKRTEVFMSEVDRQDLLLKSFHVHNGEVSAVLVPGGDISVHIILHQQLPTSRISKVFEMKMEGPAAFSFRHRPRRISSRHSTAEGLMFYFFYGRYIESSILILNTSPVGE